ncbi:superoxide dismutase, Cu-Zn family [Amycolatopsis marina]|uniref:Superoxide dismutase, Cu-Zn family n=1 Tax=Amycolatopsis marina TaxID=490629 RepID=A0A1I1AVK5_9PSEU|nr:superoxide dismutase family protein [Amycolatopsis marina]SFB41917.1 superoxide dismutase, Cu-Zn family [Amycolatopsis marina]
MRRDQRISSSCRYAITLAAVGLLAVSCTDDSAPSANENEEAPAPATSATGSEVSMNGTLREVSDNTGDSITYDTELVPVGAVMRVESESENGSTTVELEIEGFLPDRGYAVHAHTEHCGPTGDKAGPHYQHKVDPQATPDDPSHDPTYANPQNEIWLDVVTNGEGNGETSTRVPFVFTDHAPNSVVVHEAATTRTGPGEAGKAGGRIACLTVPFGG